MEDAATAEIARVQLWQWAHYGARLDTGEPVTPELVDACVDEAVPAVKKLVPGVTDAHIALTTDYIKKQVRKHWPSDFLTSDLMYYLETADGVETQWQRASL